MPPEEGNQETRRPARTGKSGEGASSALEQLIRQEEARTNDRESRQPRDAGCE